MANAGAKTSFFSQRPWVVSLILLIGLVLWVGSGHSNENTQATDKSEEQVLLTKVGTEVFVSEPVLRTISLYGRTAPDRDAVIAAEAAGRVTQVNVKKGSLVKKGALLMFIDKGDREAQLERAEALLVVRQKEYNAAKSLQKRGLQGEVAFSQAEANLIDARASLENLKLALANTEVRAPFDGIVDDLMVDVGDYLGIGDPMATIIDLDPLVVVADVSEKHITQIDSALPATVRLVNGEEKEGRLRYQSSLASASTNTFNIEIEIPNPDQKIPAGVSAEVEMALELKDAVKLSPSVLALDEQGNIGVKTLKDNKVAFVAAELVKAEQNGVWLAGLGDKVEVITRGQGFVRDGDDVEVVPQTSAQ